MFGGQFPITNSQYCSDNKQTIGMYTHTPAIKRNVVRVGHTYDYNHQSSQGRDRLWSYSWKSPLLPASGLHPPVQGSIIKNIPYSRKYWPSLNLALWLQTECKIKRKKIFTKFQFSSGVLQYQASYMYSSRRGMLGRAKSARAWITLWVKIILAI